MSNSILAAHTAAPWDVIREDDYDGPSTTTFVKHIGPFHIEWHDDLNKGNPERIEADIALASAAPDLLAALQCMLEQFTKTPSTLKDSEARGKAHAAIKKATGVRP